MEKVQSIIVSQGYWLCRDVIEFWVTDVSTANRCLPTTNLFPCQLQFSSTLQLSCNFIALQVLPFLYRKGPVTFPSYFHFYIQWLTFSVPTEPLKHKTVLHALLKTNTQLRLVLSASDSYIVFLHRAPPSILIGRGDWNSLQCILVQHIPQESFEQF